MVLCDGFRDVGTKTNGEIVSVVGRDIIRHFNLSKQPQIAGDLD